MILGIFAKTFARATVEEVFDAVTAHNLRCVQFNFACAGLPSMPGAIEPAVLERIRKAASTHDLVLAAVSGTFNMIHPDENTRRDGLRKLKVTAAASKSLGAPMVTLCTGTRDAENMWRAHRDNSSESAWRDLTHSMQEALAIAETNDVMLGIEPEVANVVDSARKARRLLDEMKSPRLKVILDPANLFRPGELPRMKEIIDEAFSLIGSNIAIAHAKELGFDGHASELALGTGALDWGQYLHGLAGTGFDGPLIMHGFDEAAAARSTAFLREKLAASSLP